MTLFVRDEADIIDAQIAFHLNAGVDIVLATDNGSTDGTTEVLNHYAQDGELVYTRNPEIVSQVDTVTNMAQRAAAEFGADWVINADADEFWFPRRGSLKEIFTSVPGRFGAVRGMLRNFVPRPDAHAPTFFAERMTVRRSLPSTDRLDPFKTYFKTAHRGDPEVQVGGGNHEVVGRRLIPLPDWYPIDVLHFPIRSLEQCARKFVRWWQITSTSGVSSNPYYDLAHKAHREGRMEEFYATYIVSDSILRERLAADTLAIDTRLRDALREMQTSSTHGGSRFRRLGPQEELRLTSAELDEGYTSELAVLADQTPLVRAQQVMEAVESRLRALEHRSRFDRRVLGR